jgi:hypothetical protein
MRARKSRMADLLFRNGPATAPMSHPYKRALVRLVLRLGERWRRSRSARLLQPAERLGVGALRGDGQVGLREKCGRGVAERRAFADRPQPPDRASRASHRRECVGETRSGTVWITRRASHPGRRCRGEWDIPRETLRAAPDIQRSPRLLLRLLSPGAKSPRARHGCCSTPLERERIERPWCRIPAEAQGLSAAFVRRGIVAFSVRCRSGSRPPPDPSAPPAGR